MIKICVMGTRGFPFIQGGVESHCESLYPLFGDDYLLIIFRRKPYVNSFCTYQNIRFIDLPSTKIKGFETVFHSFLSTCFCLFVRPDIVHIHNIGPALFSPLLKIFGIKTVLTYHSPNYEHQKWGLFAKILLRLSEKIAFSTSNSIIFVNKFQMEKCSNKIKQKSHYIPNGIRHTSPSVKMDHILDLSLLPHKYVLSVGRITQEKGFDCLIKAFESNMLADYKLVIAGGVETESSYFKELQKLIVSNRVVFTGYVFGEKLNQLYTHAGLYVLSSYNEGFPLVLLEAMSYGLDVLVSDISATHLVKLSADDYFEKGNYKELANKMLYKIMYPQERTYDLQAYNWKNIVQAVDRVYRQL